MMKNETGIFTDTRDGNRYKIVKIGNQFIMAENLAYKPDLGNYCIYNNDPINVKKYGYLYDWETAQEVPPDGWHLPSNEEWETLHKFLGVSNLEVFNALKEGGKSGFNALLSGLRNPYGEFFDLGGNANFWSSTVSHDEYGVSEWWCFFCGDDIHEGASLKCLLHDYELSVRLFRD
jgi:uncharacterized protein (TIGR02145 family)